MKQKHLYLRKLWLSLLLLVGATAIASAQNVATIGTTEYETLQAAVDAVPADGTETTIQMIANEAIDVVGSAITIPSTKNIVLDLAGHTVSGQCTTGKSSALIQNLGTLKVQDSSGEGKLTMSAEPVWVYSEADPGGYASDLIRNEKNLTVESGLLYNYGTGYACYAIDNFSVGNVTINGGKIDAAKASAIRLYYNNGGSLTVNNGIIGHFTGDDDCTYYGIQVMSGENVNATVNGGTIAGQYAFYANNTGGNIAISGGTLDGYVGFAASVPNIEITGGAFNGWVGTWGSQTKFILGGIYKDKVAEKYIADGYILADNTDPETMEAYPYAVRQPHYICAIGDTKYETLADAVADAVKAAGTAETTITLLTEAATDGVISGDGVVVPSGSNITFDLNGLTYDVSGKTVGSSGTENQDLTEPDAGFQLLQGSNITFKKNGTLKATSPTAQFIIQNYSNLKLEDVNLDGTGLSGKAYALSNNCGTINLTGSTSITAKSGGRAFETCKFGSYEIPTVNINTTGVISGPIEATGGKLNIENGKFDVTWVTDANYAAGDIQIKGGVFTKKPAEEYCAEGCIPSANTDEATKAVYPYTVKEGKFICAIGETKYETLADAVAAAGTAETTITLLTEAATEGVISGDGVVVPSGSNITFDLNGRTYDVSGKTVGSAGYETQAFQLLKDSKVTFKNGTITSTSAYMLIKNYCDLTLTDVTLEGSNLLGSAPYTLSNNCGNVNINGETNITAKTGGFAFDTCKSGSYAIPTVNINTTGTITGKIEATGGKLNIENGKFDVTWSTSSPYAAGDIQIKGGVYTAEPAEEYCAEGYIPTENTDEETSGTYPYAVKTKDDVFNGIATDISSVLDQESEIEGIYTTNGVKVEHVVKGVNVIRYKDGRIKKVSIK